jgi:hypothetical protein
MFNTEQTTMTKDTPFSVYEDRSGRQWLLVSETSAGIYAWFRPIEHATDGYYDRHFKLSAMKAAENEMSGGSIKAGVA